MPESTMSETYRHFTRLFPYPHERVAVGSAATDAMARYDELAKLGRAEGFVPFFLNLNDTVLESMVIAVSLEHDIIDDAPRAGERLHSCCPAALPCRTGWRLR